MKNFMVITLGTGVGSGIVVNGQMVYGSDGFAGELGHMIVRPHGRQCGCGRKGCLEAYCSATGVARSAREFLKESDESSLLRDINADDITALDVSIGLPTPANALFWGSLIIGAGNKMDSSPIMCLFIIAGIFLSSWLMVSEIPMFALKFKEWSWKNNQVKYIFLLTCIPLVAIFGIIGFAIIIAWYVVVSYLIKK